MDSEKSFEKRLQVGWTRLTNSKSRLWRNNVGKGWVGKHKILNGVLKLTNFRRIVFGLAVGSSDEIGFTSVLITEDMVGRSFAVFTAIETKSKKGKEKDHQMNFINMVRECGGIAGVARSEDDVKKILGEFYGQNISRLK